MPREKLHELSPHKAIQTLRQLHGEYPSSKLASYLSSLESARNHTLEVFTAGIEAFTHIANLSPSERIKFYGNQFAGLHYNNDLKKAWNSTSSETIEANQLNLIGPREWDYQLEDGYLTLVYKGDEPSAALDKLLQGPTVIDCAIFCQLSIWFGIRYMLGNAAFNELFGSTPFYLSQLIYNSIEDPSKAYMGNPLYPFFEPHSLEEESSLDVYLSHIENHKLYSHKHPGGNYGGENCVVLQGKYIIFDPMLENKSNLSKRDVEQLLLQTFNAPPDSNDAARLALYQKADTASIHPKMGMSYSDLIKMAGILSGYTIDTIKAKQEVVSSDSVNNGLHLRFNFEKFSAWIKQMSDHELGVVDYIPLRDDQLHVPNSLTDQIPYENRSKMSFSAFKVDTPLQKEMFSIAKKFCLDVMAEKSVSVILTGKAGIGKTASAVSCAKELASQGKKVVWFSEVMVRGWTDKAESMAELEACRDEICRLLENNPDAVFLDDDNLVGYSGKVLLEEIYSWYVNNPGKGLFITSNEPLSFKECYGFKLDKTYHYPPFPGYTSPQYQNTLIRSGLSGDSLRQKPSLNITECADEEKMRLLKKYSAGPSTGIIVASESYKREAAQLGQVEFIPGFEEESTIAPITRHLVENGTLGPAWDSLTPTQQKYTRRFPVNKYEYRNGVRWDTGIFRYSGIAVRAFERTNCAVIAVELLQARHWSGQEIIEADCLQQLLRVINYVHDCGGKKVIIINNTKFSHDELLDKIKEGIPEREKERTLARIDALLFSPTLVTDTQLESETEKSKIPRLFPPPTLSLFFESACKNDALNEEQDSSSEELPNLEM